MEQKQYTVIGKSELLTKLGSKVDRVTPLPFIDPLHFCNRAKKMGEEDENGFFSDQFETDSNWSAHYETTGPEIWRQTGGKIDAFVMGAGTSGTIAGISRYLKEQNKDVLIALVDPPGSSLYNKVNSGVCYSVEEEEGKRRRSQVDTIIEGVGITGRVTKNFKEALIDKAYKGTDKEAVEMSNYLLRNEGLFVGSSTSLNLVGVVKLARDLGPGHVIVTLLCDSGTRHLTKFWNDQFLEVRGLKPSHPSNDLDFIH
eukprot:TRINITY_DN1925_c1_g1_i2.p1 TRINITY_DN1925_c1_g1~~TRINITY_DN1925_c1_g1_i2.p1  ORF type:complete len:256 (-),score=88.51 TRINITY_DN1925_c1_g1_i2:99-866(-)